MAIPIKKTFYWGGSFTQFQRFSHYHHYGEHSSVQADVVLELRALHLTGNRKPTDSHTEGGLSKRDLNAHPHSEVTYLLQQGHTS